MPMRHSNTSFTIGRSHVLHAITPAASSCRSWPTNFAGHFEAGSRDEVKHVERKERLAIRNEDDVRGRE